MEKIISYIIEIGLTMEDANYYINNGYTFEETVKAIEEVNNSILDFDIEEF